MGKALMALATIPLMIGGLFFFGFFLNLGLDVSYDTYGATFTAIGGGVFLAGFLSLAYWLNNLVPPE